MKTGPAKTIALTIPADWHFFRGHFDDMPILAGVVQLNEIVMRELRACWPEHRQLRRVHRPQVPQADRPGDALELELTRTPPGKVAFELRRGAAVASSGTFEFLSAHRARVMNAPLRTCALIPTFDNPLTIAGVVSEVRRHLDDVLVVDDGSHEEARRVLDDIAAQGRRA